MSNYKALIDELKEFTYWQGQSGPESRDIHPPICEKAANTIETLLVERDALLDALRGDCSYCVYADNKIGKEPCNNCFYSSRYSGTTAIHLGLIDNWKWRGIGGSDGT